MLTYFLPDYNNYKIRTQQLPANTAYMRVDVQNMLTNEDYSFLANPGQWSYNECESIVDISFNLNIPLNVNVGDEYRMFLTPGITSSTQPFTYGNPVWHGSLQVFASQSVDKPSYVNQIPLEGRISMDSDNTFIYWDQAAPVTPTTTTTTLAPTTTTTLSPTTTTIAPTTTTTTIVGPTTTTTAAPGQINIYLAASGIVPDDVRLFYAVNNTSSFNDLGLRTPTIYPNYLNAQTLNIANTETIYVGVTTTGSVNILFGTGSASGQFLSNCGLLTPAIIQPGSWSGSTQLYINIETQGGQYASC